MVALAVGAREEFVRAMAAISPVLPAGDLGGCARPKLIVCGGKDTLIPQVLVIREASRMAEPKKVAVVPEADHFWWGHEEKVAFLVADFFAALFRPSGDF